MFRRIVDCLLPRNSCWTPNCYTLGLFNSCLNRHEDNDLRDDIDPQIVQTSSFVFNEFQQKMTNIRYMPSLAGRANIVDREQVLVYLTVLSMNGHRSPFTAGQQVVIDASNQAKRFTAFWLNIGVPLALVIGCTSLVGLMALNNHIHPAAVVAAPVAVGACCTALNSCCGCIVTGTNPDDSSNKSNDTQDVMNGIVKQTFLNLAQDLVELKAKKPEFATAVAENLNIDNLKAEFVKWSYGEDFKSIVKPLETAQLYVLNMPLDLTGLPSAEIRSHIWAVHGGPYESLYETGLDEDSLLQMQDFV